MQVLAGDCGTSTARGDSSTSRRAAGTSRGVRRQDTTHHEDAVVGGGTGNVSFRFPRTYETGTDVSHDMQLRKCPVNNTRLRHCIRNPLRIIQFVQDVAVVSHIPSKAQPEYNLVADPV